MARATAISTVSISDTATGDAPGLFDFSYTGNPVKSGDFTYTSTGSNNLFSFVVGDGNNDIVTWSFNFKNAADWAKFPTSGNLQSASLTLTLSPRNRFVDTDTVSIAGLSKIETSAIRDLDYSLFSLKNETVSINLLNYYTSSQIFGSLSQHDGSIPFVYEDDAVVTYAKLDLVAPYNAGPSVQPVPEPSTMALVACGAIGLTGMAGRKARRRSQAERNG